MAAAPVLMVGSVEGGGGTAAGLEVAFMVVIPMLVLVAALLEVYACAVGGGPAGGNSVEDCSAGGRL